jgi:hypothetical protein
MADVAPAPVATEPAPATIPLGQAPTLRAFEEARSKGLKELPNPAAKPADAPDPDVEAEPELRKAIDELEPPKPEETSAEKAARTRRHKEAAIKQRITKLAKARDEQKTAREQAEAELTEWRSGRRTAQPAPKAGEKPASEASKPTLKDFPLEKFKDEDDPYAAQSAALAEAVADWKWEQHQTADRASRQREQAEQDDRALAKAFDESFVEARTRIPDFDAVLSTAEFPRTPATPALLDLVMRSPVKADMAYHLAKHPDVTTRLLESRTRDALIFAFAEVQADVKAALKAKAKPAAPPTVTSAQEPLQPVTAGAGTGVVAKDPKSMTLSEWEAHRSNGGGRR